MAESAMPGLKTAQEVAALWVEAVMDRSDLRAAWPLTDDVLRLVLAQDWIWAHRHHPWVGDDAGRDKLARALSSPAPDHALWDRFASELLELWQKIWKGFNARSWRPRPDPEILALDLETVTFVETGGQEATPERSAFARRFALRHTAEGWKIASINGEQMFVPGWPPSLEDHPQ